MFTAHRQRRRVFHWAVLGLLAVFIVTSGLGCRVPSAEEQAASKPVTIRWWRAWDDATDVQPIIDAYRAMHPNVTIEYRRFRFEEYERALLEAFAEDRGPDIFSVQNTWLTKYQSKLTPAPAAVSIPYESTVTRFGIKKEKVIELRQNKLLTPAQVREQFVDVVGSDLVRSNQIYALPLSVDTLALFYNKDILNGAGIPQPPKSWLEFQDQVKKMTRLDKRGNVVQAGAALGTGKNVARSFDILSLLMLQNGTVMTQGNAATFNQLPPALKDRGTAPGIEALVFYTDFASPTKEVYTWNADMPNSLDAFLSGQVAFFFGYSYHLQDIRDRAPKLNLGYTTVPQIEGNQPVNYANYWAEGVSRKSTNQNWAWDFIQFATSHSQVKSYLDTTTKPTALRSMVSYQVSEEKLLPFASQLLTAKSWYQGRDAGIAETAFTDMIEAVVKGELPVTEAVNVAAGKIQQTL